MLSHHLILCTPFFFCLQPFPASASFLTSWFFAPCGQSIGASAPASVLLMNIQGWFSLGLTGLISLQSKRLSAPQDESISSLSVSLFYGPTLTSIHGYWKNHSFDYTDLCQQSHASAFQYAIQVCHIFPSKAVGSFNFMTAVTVCSNFGTQENKICHCFHFSPFYLLWSDGTKCHDLYFFECCLSSQLFNSPLSPSSRGSFIPLHFLLQRWWDCWYFSWRLDSGLWFIQPSM